MSAAVKLWKLPLSSVVSESWDDYEVLTPAVGSRVYVVQRELMAGAPGWRLGGPNVAYILRADVPVTNRGIVRANGWLGTTNNVDRTALGQYEVVKVIARSIHLRRMEREA